VLLLGLLSFKAITMSFGISLWLLCYRPEAAAVLHTHIYCTDCGPIACWLHFPYHSADQTRVLYIYIYCIH
jgi:hypothetical protein